MPICSMMGSVALSERPVAIMTWWPAATTCLGGFTDGGGHVAVVVHQGAVHVQGDMSFCFRFALFISPVIGASD